MPPDNKNSGQSLAQLVAEKASPVADVTYVGVTFGIQAKKEGVVTGYKPAAWNDIPAGLKDADGAWFTIHSGTLGLMVNVLAAALLAFTIFFYIAVYTMWLKRSTPQNIVIGGAAGALPPMVGYAAATGDISLASVILFAIIFVISLINLRLSKSFEDLR